MQFLVASMRREITPLSPARAVVLLTLAAVLASTLFASAGRAAAPVEALIPSSAPSGSPAISLTLRVKSANLPPVDDEINKGVTSFALLWNKATLPATKTVGPEETTFTATVGAKRLDGAPGVRSVQAANCYPDGTCRPVSAAAEFTIGPAPAPVIAAITPDRKRAGTPAFTLVVTGTGFRPRSVVAVGPNNRPTTYVSPTRLRVAVPAADVAAAARVRIRVKNPAKLGGVSNGKILRVTAPAPGPVAPSISSISPTSAAAGSRALDLTVRGSGFDSGSRVRFDGVLRTTTFVNGSTLIARLPAAALVNSGPEAVSVVGSAGGNTGSLTFVVTARPEIFSLSPGTVLLDGGSYRLTVTGTGFAAGATIQLDGVDVPTNSAGPGTLTAVIGPAQLTTPGAVMVRVVNPAGKGGASPAKTLVVQLAPEPVVPAVPLEPPTISQVAADTIVPGEVATVIGTHFGRLRGDAEILIGGVPAELAGEWGDSRLDVRVPDVPAGAVTLTLRTVQGEAGRALEVEEPPMAPPIANPVLLPTSGGRIIFDASIALDPASGAGPGDRQANVIGLTGITAILWRFGDGSTSTEVAPTKAYTEPGTYSPSVTVTTRDGRTSTTAAGTVRVRRGSRGRLISTPPPVNFSIPSRVVFDVGESALRPESRPYLLRLAALVKRVGRRTEVGGHSDNSGSFEVGQRLSIERARAVRNFLIREGKVPQGLLTAVGYGETRPIASNATALGRQRNRRVELKIDRGDTPIRLTSRQLLINQRISQAAIARANALEKRLTSGLTSRDIRDGSLMPQDFGPSVAIAGVPALATSAGTPAPRLVVKAPRRSGKRLPVSERQLLINQRISQAAVRRVNRLDEVLDAGLTGAAIRDGGIGPDDLAPDIAASRDGDAPAQGSFVLPALRVAAASTGKVRATQEQLIINQRVSQAAIRRLNLAIARFEKGLTSEDFRDGSLSAADLPG